MSPDGQDPTDVEILVDPLSERMEQEYGKRGKYAAEMLETAKGLLTQQEQYPRQATAIATCIRQAVEEIFEGESYEKRTLSSVSGQVIAAKKRYQTAVGQPDAERNSLKDLLDEVNRLEEIRGNSTIHRDRLTAAIRARTGSAPHVGDGSLPQVYEQLICDLNDLVHGGLDGQQGGSVSARMCYEKAIRLLARIFLPVERLDEIDRLAELVDPQDDDANRLKEIVESERDFDYFASRMRSPAWFNVMDLDMLKSPTGAAPWWLRSSAHHLKDDHYAAFINMINENFDRWVADGAGLGEIGYVGYILKDRGLSLLTKALRANSSDASLCHYALLAYADADPSSQEIVKMADRLMNVIAGINEYHKTNTVPTRLIEGMDMDSSIDRIKILSYKMKAWMDCAKQPSIRMLESVMDMSPDSAYGPNALVGQIRAALEKAKSLGISTQDLVRALDPLPECLKTRFTAWLYAQAEDVRPSQMEDFLTSACGNRHATGDDGLLLDRLRRDGHMDTVAVRMAGLIGSAPEPSKMAGEPRQWRLSDEERRRVSWALVLGGRTRLDGWDQCLGTINNLLAQETAKVEGLVATDVHYTVDPREMAARVGTAGATTTGTQGQLDVFGTTGNLEGIVRRDAPRWAEDPIQIIRLLRHPTHVADYFRGLARAKEPIDAHAGQLVRAVQFVSGHPWPAAPVSPSPFSYEPGWDGADIAGMGLIEAIVQKNIRLDEDALRLAWDTVLRMVAGQAVESSADSGHPLDVALSRPHNSALETMIHMVRYAQRLGSSVPDEVPETLTRILRLGGQDGAERRAIIGAWASFLRCILPDWFGQNEPLLFGNEAPDNLGQAAFDMHLAVGHPNRNDLEKYREKVLNAVKRDVGRSMDWLMWGMVAKVDGYEPEYLAGRLPRMGSEYSSLAAMSSARMLKSNTDPDSVGRGVSLWECMLDLPVEPKGLAGYGWWADVYGMEQDLWERMTLRTCKMTEGNLEWAWSVAKRVRCAKAITDDGLRILWWLIRADIVRDGPRVAIYALEALRASKDKMEMRDSWILLRDTMRDHGYHQAGEI